MTAMTAEGAEQFVRAYYAERSQVLQENSRYSKYLPQYMSQTCECRTLLDFYERKVLGQDLRLVGDPYNPAITAQDVTSNNRVVVVVKFHVSRQVLLDKKGQTVGETPALDETDRVTLVWQEGRWYVAETSV